jgi:hypothetical protein
MVKASLLIFIAFVIFGCKDDDTGKQNNNGAFTVDNVFSKTPSAEFPYQLTEENLSKLKATESEASGILSSIVPDSISAMITEKGAKAEYIPLVKIETEKDENYLVVSGISKKKNAAVVLAFDKDKKLVAALPFLIPDSDATTTQISTIDKNKNITRSITRKKGSEIIGEGKDVFAFDKKSNQFSWVVTDLLDEDGEIINPIDTFRKTHRLSGDYVLGKRNLISVRDGRNEKFLNVYVHTEKNEGECSGELRGEFFLTSSNTAVYRQGGDPCVLQITFSASSVTLKEEQGCGNRRGVDCPFTGSFTRKKEAKQKTNSTEEKK